jgi:hypothetical protein
MERKGACEAKLTSQAPFFYLGCFRKNFVIRTKSIPVIIRASWHLFVTF